MLHTATRALPPPVLRSRTDLERVDCAVIVVTYNSGAHISPLLDSLPAAADGLSVRCVVVDNDSRDETVHIVSSRDDVLLVHSGANLGYSGAINIGRACAGRCSSLFIVNPDAVLEPGCIAALYAALHDPQVGVAVPMLLNEDGSLYLTLRRDPSVTRALGDALFGSRLARRPGWLGETIRDHRVYASPHSVAWATGAAMLVSTDCDRVVGSWDESRFFLYSEETDFATRARRAGYLVRFVPTARVRHEQGGSGRSSELDALLAVNRIRYYEKYHRRPATSLFRIAVTLHYLLRSWDSSARRALAVVSRRARWVELPGRVAA